VARQPRNRLMTYELDGPFFTRDPEKTYRQNIRTLMDRMADLGEAEVRARLAPGPSAASAGRYIRGRTRSIKTGERWATYMVVSASNPALDGPTQRRVNAQLSGRRTAAVQMGYTPLGRLRAQVDYPLGTTAGAGGREAFKGAAGAIRRVIREANLTEGM
jgi:hypothetical protein